MKIITALNNPKINKMLKEDNRFEIVCRDIQYREAIIEILEKIKDINLIIINEKISGEIELIELIEKIKLINNKIKLVIIMNKKNIYKEKVFRKKGIEEIYYDEDINYKKIIEIINKFKNIKKNKVYIKNNRSNKKKKTEIISIFGDKKTGKTTIIILFIYYLINRNKKILLINSNEKIIKDYFKDKKSKKIYNKKGFLKEIKINKNLYLINSFETSLYMHNKNFLNDLIKKYNKKYDYILVYTKTKSNINLYSQIIENSSKIILIIEGNILGIKKIEEIFEKFKRKDDLDKNSLHIIENKYYFRSINNQIIKNIIGEKVQVHKMNRRKKYKDLLENTLKKLKNYKKIKLNKYVEKILLKIIK